MVSTFKILHNTYIYIYVFFNICVEQIEFKGKTVFSSQEIPPSWVVMVFKYIYIYIVLSVLHKTLEKHNLYTHEYIYIYMSQKGWKI